MRPGSLGALLRRTPWTSEGSTPDSPRSASASTTGRSSETSGQLRAPPKHRQTGHSSARSWTRAQLTELRAQTHHDFAKVRESWNTGKTSSRPSSRTATPRSSPSSKGGSGSVNGSGSASVSTTSGSVVGSTPRSQSSTGKASEIGILRKWLVARHGNLDNAFRALDADQDGWISIADVLDELKKPDAAESASPPPSAPKRLARELDCQWQGFVGLSQFLLILGQPKASIECPTTRLVGGDITEVTYKLEADETQHDGTWEPVLVLVPAAAAAAAAASADTDAISGSLLRRKLIEPAGTVRVQVPEHAAPGMYQWKVHANMEHGMASLVSGSNCEVLPQLPLPPEGLTGIPVPCRCDELRIEWFRHAGVLGRITLRYEVEAEPVDIEETKRLLAGERHESSETNDNEPETSFTAESTGSMKSTCSRKIRASTGDGREAHLILRSVEANVLYRVRARAFSRAGPGPWSEPIMVKAGSFGPSTPEGVRILGAGIEGGAAGTQRLRLSWSAPQDVHGWTCIGYTAYCQTSGPSTPSPRVRRVASGKVSARTRPVQVQVDPNLLEWEFEGLRGNHEYRLWVATRTNVGESPHSEYVVARTAATLPSAPGPPSLAPRAKRSCAWLQWEPPCDDGGLPIVRYECCGMRRWAGSNDSELDQVAYTAHGSFTEVRVDDCLRKGGEYIFQVRAITAIGAGPWGPEGTLVSCTVLPPEPPMPPGRPLASAFAPGKCQVTWAAPPDDCGSPLVRYFISADSVLPRFGEAHPVVELPASGCGQEASCVMEHLRAGSEYTFRVQAENAAGRSEYSESSVSVRAGPALPGPPRRLKVSENQLRRVLLEWKGPACHNSSEALRYRVTAKQVGTGLPEEMHETVDDAPIMGVPVHPATRYIFRVATISSAGMSPCVSTGEVLTARMELSAPQNLKVTGVTGVSATLSWELPLDAIPGEAVGRHDVFIFEVAGSGRPRLLRVEDTGSGKTTHTIQELQSGSSYCAQVRAVALGSVDGEAGICSEPSAVFTTPARLPGPPQAPVVRSVGVPTRASLTWQSADPSDDAPLSQYIILIRRVDEEEAPVDDPGSAAAHAGRRCGSRSWQQDTGSARTTHTVTGLLPGACYEFRVKAINAAGESPLSEPSAVYSTGPRLPPAPGKPWLYGPAAHAPHDPVIAFASPQDASVPIDAYRCVAFAAGRPEATKDYVLQVLGTDGAVVTAVVAGLEGGQEYQFSVQASNASGWGPLGQASAPTLVWRPLPPGRPRLLRLNRETGAVRLAFTPVQEDGFESPGSYAVHVRRRPSTTAGADLQARGDEALWTKPVQASIVPQEDHAGDIAEVSAEVCGLERGYMYFFRVQAAEGREPRAVSQESEGVELAHPVPSVPGRPICTLLANKNSNAKGTIRTTQIQLQWGSDSWDKDTPLLGYRLLVYKLSAAAQQLCEAPLNPGPCMLEDHLKPLLVEAVSVRGVATFDTVQTEGTQGEQTRTTCSVDSGSMYCFEVQAMNVKGTSAPSQWSSPLYAPPAVPSICRGLMASRSGERSVRLSWQPPAESGGQNVKSYNITINQQHCGNGEGVQCKGYGDAEYIDTLSAEGLSSHWVRHDIKSLLPGHQYTFSVSASNDVGEGEGALTPWPVLIPEAWQQVTVILQAGSCSKQASLAQPEGGSAGGMQFQSRSTSELLTDAPPVSVT